jgi:hypothetical protein
MRFVISERDFCQVLYPETFAIIFKRPTGLSLLYYNIWSAYMFKVDFHIYRQMALH